MTARSLAGRTALVTGGGRGIGAAAARLLAAAGARVIVSARSRDEIEAVAASLRDGGHEAEALGCDVGDEDAVAALARDAGPVDVLVNNAGASTAAPLARTDLATWERMLRVNATGTFLCTRAFLPGMVEGGWGRVVNVASVAGLAGERYIAAYSAAKHAVVGLTRSVAAEVAGSGVTVNAVCPGYVDTAMTDASVARIAERTGREPDDARAALLAHSGQPRFITADEVAGTVAWLCGPDAGGVHGASLVIDGGMLRR